MAGQTIFRGAIDFFIRLGIYDVVLPFLLIFTIVFAILDKTRILGKKKDINAVVALAFGLLTVGVPMAIKVMLNIIPIIAIIIVILLGWILTYGFIGGYKEGMELSILWRRTFQIILILAFIGAIAWATGTWNIISDKPWASQIGQTIILVGAMVAVFAIVISGKEEP